MGLEKEREGERRRERERGRDRERGRERGERERHRERYTLNTRMSAEEHEAARKKLTDEKAVEGR